MGIVQDAQVAFAIAFLVVSVPATNIKTASFMRPMSGGVYWPFAGSGLSIVSKAVGTEFVVPFSRDFSARTRSRHCLTHNQ